MHRPYAHQSRREIPENPNLLRRYPLIGRQPASCPRDRTPSFAYACVRCASTVCTVTYSTCEISLLERPLAASSTTRHSAAVSCPLGFGRRAPTRERSERAWSTHPPEPSRSNAPTACSSERRAAP